MPGYEYSDVKSVSNHTIRLIRKTRLLPSGPRLISRSWSTDEPRLKTGEEGIEGPAAVGDIAGANEASRLGNGWLGGFLASLLSSSGVN